MMELEITVFIAPHGIKREATLPVEESLKDKVEKILSAGFRFEGEYSSSLISTTITGPNGDHSIVVSTDLHDQKGHVAKVEDMIKNFDIKRALKNDKEWS